MDNYAQHWRTFRFWNRLGILVVVALLPVVAFGAFLAQGSGELAALPYLLVLMWLVALGGALYRIRTFRCPRCGKTFSVHGWWTPNTRGRRSGRLSGPQCVWHVGAALQGRGFRVTHDSPVSARMTAKQRDPFFCAIRLSLEPTMLDDAGRF